MRYAGWWIGSLFALTVPQGAAATTVFPQEFTCPVGGEKFEDFVVGSTSSWGQRPDGRAIGGVDPWPVIECPGNGFPIFKEEFAQAELSILAPAIADPEFRRMRETDTTYRRVWWLRRKLGADPYSLAMNLLSASWETDDDPARKVRYQIDFAKAAEALVRTQDLADDWFWLNLRAANAYREAGRFDDAARVLSKVDRPEFLPQEEDQREGARMLIDGLVPLIAQSNRASEPTNLVAPRNAAARCLAAPADMTDVEQAACVSEAYQEAIRESISFASDAETEVAADAAEAAAADAAAAAAAAVADAEANAEAMADLDD